MDTQELEKLFELKEKGIITEEQFNEKKKQLLNIESDVIDIPQLPKQGERLFNADYDKTKTWLSYGQTMLIQISKSKQSTSVSIFGKCISFQAFDWGEKKKITNKIFNYIENNL